MSLKSYYSYAHLACLSLLTAQSYGVLSFVLRNEILPISIPPYDSSEGAPLTLFGDDSFQRFLRPLVLLTVQSYGASCFVVGNKKIPLFYSPL